MRKYKLWLRSCLALLLVVSLLPGSMFVQAVEPAESLTTGEPFSEDRISSRTVAAGNISVPSYSGGTSSGWMTYDCGTDVTYGNTGTESRMQIVTSTTEAQYKAYCKKLESSGSYSKIYSKTVAAQSGSNLYAKYLAKDGTHALYTYFTAAYKQTRIIVDTQCESFRAFPT